VEAKHASETIVRKKLYRSPVLKNYGTVRDLTLGMNLMTPFADLSMTCSGGTDSTDCTTP
jgi:hypothetical protein